MIMTEEEMDEQLEIFQELDESVCDRYIPVKKEVHPSVGPKLEMTFKISLENFNKLDKVAKENEISFDEVVQQKLKVMDLTAITMAQENNISIVVFAQKSEQSLVDAVCARGKFTIIKNRG